VGGAFPLDMITLLIYITIYFVLNFYVSVKTSELRLQEAIRESEEKIQMNARELFTMVDAVSKYKEYAESRISEMKSELAETAVAVSDAHKGSLPAQFRMF
jgi:kinetochore protein NDC80